MIKQEHAVEVRSKRDVENLRQKWEEAKAKLSRLKSCTLETFLPEVQVDLKITVTKDKFEKECFSLFEKIAHEVVTTETKAQVR